MALPKSINGLKFAPYNVLNPEDTLKQGAALFDKKCIDLKEYTNNYEGFRKVEEGKFSIDADYVKSDKNCQYNEFILKEESEEFIGCDKITYFIADCNDNILASFSGVKSAYDEKITIDTEKYNIWENGTCKGAYLRYDSDYDGTIDYATYDTYDENNNAVKSEVDFDFDGKADDIVNHYYDEKNNIIKEETDFGADGFIDMEAYQFYNEDGSPSFTDFKCNFDIDGKIDESSQGSIGDCWLLAGINSLSYTKDGADIIKNAITKNNDSYSVELKGINKTYTITNEELFEAKNAKSFVPSFDGEESQILSYYSSKDSDVLLLECAFEKAYRDILNNPREFDAKALKHVVGSEDVDDVYCSGGDVLSGGYPSAALYFLTGEESQLATTKEEIEDVLSRFEKDFNKIAASVSFCNNTDEEITVSSKDENEILTLPPFEGHSFSLKRVNGDEVVLINPYDSSKDVVFDKNEFIKNVSDIAYLDF